MNKLLGLGALLTGAAAAYLIIAPSPIDPVAWEAPPIPLMSGALEPNDTLMKAELIGKGAIHGPEDTAVDAEGRLYASLHNSQPALDEVAGLLASLREAWAEIRSQVQPAAA